MTMRTRGSMTKLQPYEKDRPCPKCGEKGMETDHVPRKGYPYYHNHCKYFLEHLGRYCLNCHYWSCEGLAVK